MRNFKVNTEHGFGCRTCRDEDEESFVSDIVEVRGVKIGEGIPKIIVPIVGKTREEILEAAASFKDVRMDIVEWRADWFEDVFDPEIVKDVLKELRIALGNTPILFTFRTSKEGGEKAIGEKAYEELNIGAAQTGLVDLVDVEAFTGDEIVRRIIVAAHRAGVKVVQDRSYATEQKGCACPPLCNRGDGNGVCRPPDHHDVHVGHRADQPS